MIINLIVFMIDLKTSYQSQTWRNCLYILTQMLHNNCAIALLDVTIVLLVLAMAQPADRLFNFFFYFSARYIMWQKLYKKGTHKTVTSQGDFFRACSPAINMLLSFSLYLQDSRLRAILFTINFKMPPKKVSVMMK